MADQQRREYNRSNSGNSDQQYYPNNSRGGTPNNGGAPMTQVSRSGSSVSTARYLPETRQQPPMMQPPPHVMNNGQRPMAPVQRMPATYGQPPIMSPQGPMMGVPPPPMQMLSPPIQNMGPPMREVNFAPTPTPTNNGGNDYDRIDRGGISRKRTVRNVELTAQGNLVIDVPVPERVLSLGKYQSGEEFTHMRYTAATVDADSFSTAGYSLRQQEYGRKTEIFVVVTMYNEGDDLFCKTMVALMKNIAFLCSRNKSSTWGDNGWKQVVICIVSDGRTKIHPRVLNVLGVMGVYQDGIMKNKVNDKDVHAHIFEYTTQVAVDQEMCLRGHQEGFVPVQILFCLKEKNAKKINSHRWFFNAFGQLLRPNVCILIDVGTKPSHTSIYHLWKAFDRDPKVGGACGEIYAELGNGCSNLLNPLVAAQNFEYKMSNILDKPMESAFGFIAVLPGAFSAYRYVAIQGQPLHQYFKGETMHGGAKVFEANMYLAEDRILCFELVTKEKQNWILRYVKAAKAETDVPDTVPEFISQRRRWLNGSFFATANFYLTLYFLTKDQVINIDNTKIFPIGEGPLIPTIIIQVYLFSIALSFVCSLGNRPQGSKVIYTFCMLLFALSMGVMLYLGGFDIYSVIKQSYDPRRRITTYNLFNGTSQDLFFSTPRLNVLQMLQQYPAFRDMALSVGATYGMYLVASLLFLEPWHMITSMLQYLFLLPSYVNILMVYAFCNLHDVSWGTKGDNVASGDLGTVKSSKGKDGKDVLEIEVPTDRNDINAGFEKHVQALKAPRPEEKKKRDAKTKQEDYFRTFRTNVILAWIFMNGLLIVALTNDYVRNRIYSQFQFHPTGDINPYLKFVFYATLGLSGFRFLGSITFLLMSLVCG
ncbi:Chitin synthase, class 2 [Blyttiomyces sp. JEL0837]|nr:Chitin synthase, class 2 [Blyttiomyces sp. JEL0837]